MANIIFDFDGTLADTFPLIVDVSYRLSPGVKRLPDKKIEELRRLPLLISFFHLGIPWTHMPYLIRHTRKNMTESISEAPPFDGIVKMIKDLHRDGHKLFIMSSNYPKNIRSFLKHHNLDRQVTDVTGVPWGNTIIKAWALRALARRHSMDLSSSYHVGNEALDIRAARFAGMRGIAVTWSGFSRKGLARSKPFALIVKPSDLPRLLQ